MSILSTDIPKLYETEGFNESKKFFVVVFDGLSVGVIYKDPGSVFEDI